MIIDAIIGLLAPLFSIVLEGVTLVFVPVINLILLGIEALLGIFISGFSLGRLGRKRRESRASLVAGVVGLLILVGIVSLIWVVPKVMNREVTLVAEDGHSLPFAALIIRTGGGDQHERTDSAGNIVIPRFSTDSITVKDPRYVETTWKGSEIESTLTVGRTVLGASLDSFADKLLRPASGEAE